MARWYTVRIKLRGTVGKRATATKSMVVWADDPATALTKARQQALDALTWEVKAR